MPMTTGLRDVVGVSEDIREAVVFDRENAKALEWTLTGELAAEGAEEIAESAETMLHLAQRLRSGVAVTRIEAATQAGRVFVLVSGERGVAAVTDDDAMSQLVFFDLARILDA
jgi:hypothetical protein